MITESESTNTRTVKVLLVGSGARNAPILHDHLQRRGCDVFFATSLKEAIEMLNDRRFDLVLSEFMLSDGTAYHLVSPLRETDTTMFFSNAVENGCWWMLALYEGQDRGGESGMRPTEFKILLDRILLKCSSGIRVELRTNVHTELPALRNRDRKGILLIVVLCLTVLGIFLFGVLAYAQTRVNTSWSSPSPAARVAVKGTVEKVLRHACSPALLPSEKRNIHSLHCTTTDVVLSTKDGFVNVRLGPTKFIRDHHFFFVKGDQLQVIGFRAAGHGRVTVVSEEVVKSKRALTLRDSNGRPLWKKDVQHEIASNHL